MNSVDILQLRRFIWDKPKEEELQAALNGLLADLRELALDTAAGDRLKRLIRYIQMSCSEILDAIVAKKPDRSYTRAERNMACRYLSEMLQSLRKYYPDLYDVHASLADFMVKQGKTALEELSKKVLPRLKQRLPDGIFLAELIRQNRNLLTQEQISLHQFERHNALQRQLIAFCTTAEGHDFEQRLLDDLVAHDHGCFAGYYMNAVTAELEHEARSSAETAILLAYQKRLLLIPERTGEGQINECRDRLLNFISGLLWHRQRTAEGDISAPRRSLKMKRASSATYRIRVLFSADVLAYLTRLQLRCGFMLVAKKTELFNFLAANVQTAEIGENLLSANSLGVKYRQVVHATAMQTRSMLLKMVKQIDVEFG